eukprot:TRINITY_DN14830_c0_g1_i2.p1 TRINITY_DN14830_c0_g1~~TRINITY_DN14830_c0_g1_i2.p1  ORF type:complete len:186 (-),score=19.33 TRINITY_DN14830_c0_g1_i2:134-691(-)
MDLYGGHKKKRNTNKTKKADEGNSDSGSDDGDNEWGQAAVEIQHWGLSHNVHVLFVPAGCTRWMQPLDKSIFGPVKARIAAAKNQAMVDAADIAISSDSHLHVDRLYEPDCMVYFENAVRGVDFQSVVVKSFRETGWIRDGQGNWDPAPLRNLPYGNEGLGAQQSTIKPKPKANHIASINACKKT